MLPTRQGSIRLFRFAGIDLFLHWSWFLVAFYEINNRRGGYSSIIWNVLEYVALFCIILLHEFGHALACRQVGGKANQIVLWPLGGVAYVAPPPRPGATLWSIAAGPLVNVILAPPLTLLVALGSGWAGELPNVYALVRAICFINYGLLIFNLLPIYPLDGGQIVRALLWFVIGRANSLMVATVIGFIGVAGLFILAVGLKSFWIGVVAVFILLNCWRGLLHARQLARAARLPRREGFACPSCKELPFRGAIWRCARCHQTFDTFESMATCPHCGAQFPVTQCFECGNAAPIQDWIVPPPVTPLSNPPPGGSNSTVA
jgi:Zn-dependent protease